MAGELIHYGARPWAMAVNVDAGSQLAEAIERLFPTVEFVSGEDAAGLHQREFDAAILVGSAPPEGLGDHLQVLQFGGPPAGMDEWIPVGEDSRRQARVRRVDGARARNFVLGNASAQLGVTGLLKRNVIPEPGSEYKVIKWSFGPSAAPAPPGRHITEFAADSAGDTLAGYFKRSDADEAGHLWWLPETAVVDGAEWLNAAVRWWQQIDERSFPPAATWTEHSDWMTKAEIDAAKEIARLEAEAEEFRLAHEERLKRATAVQEAAQAAAAMGARRLLVAQGDELVEAVIESLRLFGFTVVDADELSENAQFKQEDLRIIDGDWVCLAEVKGYKKGAKASDLLQIGKAVEVYIERGNKRPDARWYIVNHNIQTPPGLRDVALAGAPEVAVFAGMGGAVLDTRLLFTMHRAVEGGQLSTEAARAQLRHGRDRG